MAGADQPTQTLGIADGHKIRNTGRLMLELENTHTADLVFTIQTPGKVIGALEVEDLEITVPDGETVVVGPFPTGTFNQGNDEIYVDYDVSNYAKQMVRAYQLDE